MLQFNRKEGKPENYDLVRGEGSNFFKKSYRKE